MSEDSFKKAFAEASEPTALDSDAVIHSARQRRRNQLVARAGSGALAMGIAAGAVALALNLPTSEQAVTITPGGGATSQAASSPTPTPTASNSQLRLKSLTVIHDGKDGKVRFQTGDAKGHNSQADIPVSGDPATLAQKNRGLTVFHGDQGSTATLFTVVPGEVTQPSGRLTVAGKPVDAEVKVWPLVIDEKVVASVLYWEFPTQGEKQPVASGAATYQQDGKPVTWTIKS